MPVTRKTIDCHWAAAGVRTRAGLWGGTTEEGWSQPGVEVSSACGIPPLRAGAQLGSPGSLWRIQHFRLPPLPSLSCRVFPVINISEMMADRNFVILGPRRRCSSIWRDGSIRGTREHPTSLVKEVQERASFDSFYLHTSPWTAGSCFAKAIW